MLKKQALFVGALLLLVTLAACNREDVLHTADSSSTLQGYVNAHKASLLSAFYASLSDDVTLVANSENELIFTFGLTHEAYRELDVFAQGLDIDSGAREMLDRALYDKWIRATRMADEIRDALGLDEVRITIIYTVEGDELLRRSFISGDFD